jgi:hypothetical protein
MNLVLVFFKSTGSLQKSINPKNTKMNYIDFIIAFEFGELDSEAIVQGFQKMIDDGTVWQLQGSYGRAARDLIDSGLCHY